jgi:hypothetical protein
MADLVDRWMTNHGDVVTVWYAENQQGHPRDWRWHVQARNGEVVGQGEGHTRKEAAVEAAKRHHPYVLDPEQMPEGLQIEVNRITRAQRILNMVLRAQGQPVESWQVEFVARALEMEARYGE